MARIVIEVGPLSSELVFPDGKAARTLDAVANALEARLAREPGPPPAPLTQQERLDAVVLSVAKELRQRALAHESRSLKAQMRSSLESLESEMI